jgi:hypothetical protein
MQKLRFRQKIERDWNALFKRHPDDDDLHTYLDEDDQPDYRKGYDQHRRDLCDAIDRANVSERQSNTVREEHLAALQNPTERDFTDAYERELRLKIKYLRDIKFLVGTETRVGAPANVLRAFDAGVRIRQATAEVDDAAIALATQRHDELKPMHPIQRRRAIDAHRKISTDASFIPVAGDSTFAPLGGGNNATKLGLWIKGDANGNISERTVIKDVCFDHDAGEWDDAINWQDVQDPLNKVLTEAHVMERLRDTGSANVVKLIRGRLLAADLVYRVS